MKQKNKKSNAPAFEGRVIMIGCGSIGKAILPILGNHIPKVYQRMTVLSANEAGRKIAEKQGCRFLHAILTPGNYRKILSEHVHEGDLVLNLSVGVSSIDVIRFCAEVEALYVDTSIEPWDGVFDNPMLDLHDRTNYVLRQELLKLAQELGPDAPTAVVDHGANPGMVSHFVKQALLNLNKDLGLHHPVPKTREEWAGLAQKLEITTIQISERDTQAGGPHKKQGEVINTWSIDGYLDELMQPVELSIGTHEKSFPQGAHEHEAGAGSVFLERPGASTFGRSWVPSAGGFQGMLVTHDEVFSIADYLSVKEENEFVYRPSVMFVYHPCDAAMLSALELEGNGWMKQQQKRLLTLDITEGMDELGVLLAGHEKNAYWYGSQLNIDEARRHVPYANATIMQVVSGAISAIMWAIRHPRKGVVEPEDLDHESVLETAAPYLGDLVGHYTEWTPLDGRGKYFAENLDDQDPWQFQNIKSQQWL